MLAKFRVHVRHNVVGYLALFVALGGTGIAASGGNFILGTPNTATSATELSASGASTASALNLTNTNTGAGATALELNVPPNHAPFKVNRTNRVTNLNADLLDGFDGQVFVRRGVALTNSVAAAGGVVDVTNTGTSNGVQGRTQSATAAGVYGEHVGSGGHGVAGRASDGGNAIYGDNTGTGYAGWFEDKVKIGGNLELAGSLVCPAACVSAGAVTGKVGDSDRLDGLDSTAFVQGGGAADGQALAQAPGSSGFLGPAFGGFVRLQYLCPASVGSNGSLTIHNVSSGIANFFVDSGGANPDYLQLAAGGFVTYPAAAGGESFSIQAQGGPGVLTIEVGTVHRNSSNDCHAQAQGLLTP
jgi:hypothetical protein